MTFPCHQNAPAFGTSEFDLNATYKALASCIRSGQVPDEDVPKIMAERPDFAKWYADRFLGDERTA